MNLMNFSPPISLTVLLTAIITTRGDEQCAPSPDCQTDDTTMVCGYDVIKKSYKMFNNRCSMGSYGKCYGIDYVETPVTFCINTDIQTRRMDGESCPVFCPDYYRPVCGSSNYREYAHRSFKNLCYLHMINCRGADEYQGYTQVPLSFCQRHAMKNIWKEKIVSFDED